MIEMCIINSFIYQHSNKMIYSILIYFDKHSNVLYISYCKPGKPPFQHLDPRPWLRNYFASWIWGKKAGATWTRTLCSFGARLSSFVDVHTRKQELCQVLVLRCLDSEIIQAFNLSISLLETFRSQIIFRNFLTCRSFNKLQGASSKRRPVVRGRSLRLETQPGRCGSYGLWYQLIEGVSKWSKWPHLKTLCRLVEIG